MENRAIQFIKNFSYTICSNLISLIISTLLVIIVPKIVGVEEYGYWQLYLFYTSYVGFMHFGWSDGIYLRYGGEEYSDLDKKAFSSQFYMMLLFQLFMAMIIVLISILFVNGNDRVFILIMVALNAVIVNVLSILLLTLQATNRIRDYAQINTISRVSYIFLIILFLLIGIREYKVIIVADLIGKCLSLIYAIYTCQDIVFNKLNTLNFSFSETTENISVGIKLMFANIAGMLIIGVVRFGIEYSWNVSTFGKISLMLSVSNLLMLFINATGIVVFPLLRKLHTEVLPELYLVIRDILMAILFGVLLLYFPANALLTTWLPNYADGLAFMALIFPISIYEGKMGLLVNTYLKTMRKERFIMIINLIAMLISVFLTILTTVIFRNLNAAVLSILIAISIRSIFAEIYLSCILKIKVIKDMIFESILIILFVLIGWYINSNTGFGLYLFLVSLYVFLKRKGLIISFNKMKLYIKV